MSGPLSNLPVPLVYWGGICHFATQLVGGYRIIKCLTSRAWGFDYHGVGEYFDSQTRKSSLSYACYIDYKVSVALPRSWARCDGVTYLRAARARVLRALPPVERACVACNKHPGHLSAVSRSDKIRTGVVPNRSE